MPTINQMLFFQIASSDREEADIQYRSRIADEEEDALLIELPLNEDMGRLKRLYLGDELSMYYVSSDGVKHYFDSHVIGFKKDAVQLVKILKPDVNELTKVQRRNFFRVTAELELAVKMAGHVRFICRTDDIGGGGISIICDNKWPIQTEQLLECWLLITYKNGTIDHVPFTAEIVRLTVLESGRKKAMMKFISISDTNRQNIIRYCFEKQLEFRNR